MGLISQRIKRHQLKPGDHIYSYRPSYVYAHHGIYVGGDKVIHFTISDKEKKGSFPSSSCSSPTGAPCAKCGDQSRLSGVISSCLDCFLSGGDLYLFEYDVNAATFLLKVRYSCTLASADPVEDVLHRAFYLLQNGFGVYRLFKNNCVDFAIYCKTGLLIPTDSNVTLISATATGVIVGSVLGFVAGAYCANSARRLASDVGFRSDAKKIPVEKLKHLM